MFTIFKSKKERNKEDKKQEIDSYNKLLISTIKEYYFREADYNIICKF